MDRNKFIQASANTRVLEKKLLNKSVFDRLIEASDLEEALRLLSDTVYAPFVAKLEDPKDYEEVLKAEHLRFYKEIYSISPDPIPIEIVTAKYFFHNLKVMLKEAALEEDYRNLYVHVGDFEVTKLKEDFENEKSSSNMYLDIVEGAREAFEKSKDPQVIDIYIDNAYFERIKLLAEQSDVALFEKYVKDLIDFTNIRTLLRAQIQEKDLEFLKGVLIDGGNIEKKKYYDFLNAKIDPDSALFKSQDIYKSVKKGILEYENYNSLSTFEKEMDDYFIEMIREVKKVTYGPEVIFAYCLAKEVEIKNLRIIFVSKLNKLQNEFIRERLRECYV